MVNCSLLTQHSCTSVYCTVKYVVHVKYDVSFVFINSLTYLLVVVR